MAVNAGATRLTEAHRIAQARIGAAASVGILRLWPLLDVDDLDGSFDQWLRAVLSFVSAHRGVSARLSGSYLTAFRALELGADAEPFTPTLAVDVPAAAVATSMLVTGPVSIRAARARGVPSAMAIATARAGSAAAAVRHSLNGGRDTIAHMVNGDPLIVGWARATSGAACTFCAMLAARGPVYSTGTVSFHAHDSCMCMSEPVYHRDADWPAGSRRYHDLWNDATAGLSGDDARSAFAAALTAA